MVVSPPPSATPAVAIVLQRAPTNLGCDSIGIDYDMATIRIDPAAAVQVWAEANDGTRLATYWSAGFSATRRGNATRSADDPGAAEGT